MYLSCYVKSTVSQSEIVSHLTLLKGLLFQKRQLQCSWTNSSKRLLNLLSPQLSLFLLPYLVANQSEKLLHFNQNHLIDKTDTCVSSSSLPCYVASQSGRLLHFTCYLSDKTDAPVASSSPAKFSTQPIRQSSMSSKLYQMNTEDVSNWLCSLKLDGWVSIIKSRFNKNRLILINRLFQPSCRRKQYSKHQISELA